MLRPQQLPERQVQPELRGQPEQQRVLQELREPQQPERVQPEQPVQQQRKRRR